MNTKDQWGIVSRIFRQETECYDCELLHDNQCTLLDGYLGKPSDCPQYEVELEIIKEGY